MNPNITFLLNKSLECLRSSNLESAEIYLKQAMRLQPNNAHVTRLLGVISAQRCCYSDAIKYFSESLRTFPNNPLTLSNLGNTYLAIKDYKNALDAYNRAIKNDSTYEEAWSNKGNLLYELKQYDDALSCYERALNLRPNFAEAWSNKGNTLHALKRYKEAISHYDKALSLQPNYAEALYNKGNTLNELGYRQDALTYFDRALNANPNYAEAWSNKGNTLHTLNRYKEAISHHDKALSLQPNYANFWSNKAATLSELECFNDAISHYDRAASLNPKIDWALGDTLHTKMKICDWTNFQGDLKKLSEGIEAGEKVITPFPLLTLLDNPTLQKKCAELYTKICYSFEPKIESICKKSSRGKIRIGYYSPDFGSHAVSILMAEFFELYNRDKFEIYAFSLGTDDGSPIRKRLQNSFNQFIDVHDASNLEIVQLSRKLEIDIAIDLAGHTANNRMKIFAHRVAPIQVNYIGYLGTTGNQYFDYLFADKTIIPHGYEHNYSEKIVRLPSYQANDRKRKLPNKIYTRESFGLPKDAFVFCCFNNTLKIVPNIFESWMRILNNVEGSILFLYSDNNLSEANLKNEAKLRGIDSKRLVFGKRLPFDDYLARYQICDLFLDTAPYNAGTTASDALWMGLPVLTLMGESFASRIAASLLTAIELPALITNSQTEYENLAISLAKHPDKLARLKENLAKNIFTTKLFNTLELTRSIEMAYVQMYDRHHAGLAPEHIFIA